MITTTYTNRISFAQLSEGENMILNNYIHSVIDDFDIFAGNDYDSENDDFAE